MNRTGGSLGRRAGGSIGRRSLGRRGARRAALEGRRRHGRRLAPGAVPGRGRHFRHGRDDAFRQDCDARPRGSHRCRHQHRRRGHCRRRLPGGRHRRPDLRRRHPDARRRGCWPGARHRRRLRLRRQGGFRRRGGRLAGGRLPAQPAHQPLYRAERRLQGPALPPSAPLRPTFIGSGGGGRHGLGRRFLRFASPSTQGGKHPAARVVQVFGNDVPEARRRSHRRHQLVKRRKRLLPGTHARGEGDIHRDAGADLRPLLRIERADHELGGEKLVTRHARIPSAVASCWMLRPSQARTPAAGTSK